MMHSSPLPRAIQPTHSEGTGLASNRDDRNNSLLWKKDQSNTQQDSRNGEAIKKLQDDFSKLRRMRMGMLNPFQSLEFYPFRIYNVPVPKGAPVGTAPWQCWQVRSGIAAGRSQYFINTGNFGDYYVQGEERQIVITGSDGNIQYQSTNIATNPLFTNDIVLIGDTAIAHAAAGHTATWILNSTTPDSFLAFKYSFWIELTDVPVTGLTFQIKAQRFTFDVGDPIAHFPYPILPNIIGIGWLEALQGDFEYQDVLPPDPHNLSNYQELYSHAVNRWNASAGGVYASHFRGDYAAIKGQLFWNGDEFTYDDDTNLWLLQYTNPFPAIINDDNPRFASGIAIKSISNE